MLTIQNHIIKQDANGRYCLNDLHKASGSAKRNAPNEWLRTQQAQELISVLAGDSRLAPVESIRGGKTPGTYVIKELVYAYAMWISAKFHVAVIRAYDALVTTGAMMTRSEVEAMINERMKTPALPAKLAHTGQRLRFNIDANLDFDGIIDGLERYGYRVIKVRDNAGLLM